MEDLPELDMLVEAFPNYPRSELASRLLCASSADVLINELLVEAANEANTGAHEKTKKVFHTDVDRLKELFPTANKDSLAAALNGNNGCVDKTIEHLLDTDPVQKLTKLTGLSENEVSPYMAKNNNDVLRALADVVSHYKKRKKVRTSRIQSRNGPSLAYQETYTIHENSTELLQLKECVWAEEALQKLNYDFLLKLLVFYQGNVLRVLDIARLFIEAKCHSVTFDHRLGFQTKQVPECVLPSSSVLRSNLPLLVSPRPLGPKLGDALQNGTHTSFKSIPKYNSAIRERSPVAQIAKASIINNSRLKNAIMLVQPSPTRPDPKENVPITATTRLDLHGYTVADASSTVEAAASAWWFEEKEHRAIEGHIERYGSRAEFVEPLNIITGRGIHSAGGALKIRLLVIRLLTREGYLFDESVGSVSVFGRKRKPGR